MSVYRDFKDHAFTSQHDRDLAEIETLQSCNDRQATIIRGYQQENQSLQTNLIAETDAKKIALGLVTFWEEKCETQRQEIQTQKGEIRSRIEYIKQLEEQDFTPEKANVKLQLEIQTQIGEILAQKSLIKYWRKSAEERDVFIKKLREEISILQRDLVEKTKEARETVTCLTTRLADAEKLYQHMRSNRDYILQESRGTRAANAKLQRGIAVQKRLVMDWRKQSDRWKSLHDEHVVTIDEQQEYIAHLENALSAFQPYIPLRNYRTQLDS